MDIHWERDHIIEEATDGDKSGHGWEIEISTKGRRVNINDGDDLIRGIIKASHQASAAYEEAERALVAKRKAALAKLTAEERRLLGL